MIPIFLKEVLNNEIELSDSRFQITKVNDLVTGRNIRERKSYEVTIGCNENKLLYTFFATRKFRSVNLF